MSAWMLIFPRLRSAVAVPVSPLTSCRSERMPSKSSAERAPELEPEEDDRVDRGPPTIRVALSDPGADEREVECCVELTIEVVGWDEPFEGDGGRSVEVAAFGRSKHGNPSARMANRVTYPNLPQPTFFTATVPAWWKSRLPGVTRRRNLRKRA